MALPTKIPSTFRRTPIVKRQNPALYSTSATHLNSESAFNNTSSFGTLNNYIMRYKSAIAVSARMLELQTNVDFSVIREEFVRLKSKSDRTPKEERIVGNLNIKFNEAAAYRNGIIATTLALARKDSVATRAKIIELNINNSFKSELVQIIDEISITTSGARR